jgi:transposase
MYDNFIGIDINRTNFTVAQYDGRVTKNFENDSNGFKDFYSEYKRVLLDGLVVLETTGGYEMALVKYLLKKKISVHRADTRKVKYFIRSLGKTAKSHAIDALGLAQYGYERHKNLELFSIKPVHQAMLQQLVQRRLDLKKMLVQEKNRKQAPNQDPRITKCCNTLIKAIEKQIDGLDKDIPITPQDANNGECRV